MSRARRWRGRSKAHISAPELGIPARDRGHLPAREFKVSRAPGGQQVGRAGGSRSRATPRARVGGEARPSGAGIDIPRVAGADSRLAPGGPRALPRRAAPPAYPVGSPESRPGTLGAPGRAPQPRPDEPPSPPPPWGPQVPPRPAEPSPARTHPATGAPAAAAWAPGAPCSPGGSASPPPPPSPPPLLLLQLRLLQSQRSSAWAARLLRSPRQPRTPSAGRACAPRARPPPTFLRLLRPAGTGSREPGAWPPRRAEPAAPAASRKQKGRTAAPARAAHRALCQQQTQTFPSPSPRQVTEGARAARLKGRRRRSPPSPPLGPPPTTNFPPTFKSWRAKVWSGNPIT